VGYDVISNKFLEPISVNINKLFLVIGVINDIIMNNLDDVEVNNLPKVMKYTYLDSKPLLEKAFNNVDKVTVPYKKGQNYLNRKKMAKYHAFSNTITSKIDTFIKEFPSIDHMDPLYRSILEIEVGVDIVRNSLRRLSWLNKKIKLIGSETVKNKNFRLSSYFGRIKALINEYDSYFEVVNKAIAVFKQIPNISKKDPIVVVVGYPNVGKSMFIGKVSTTKPEVGDYAFTTKRLQLGHIVIKRGIKIQILDAPGIIDKVVHNKLEDITFAAIANLSPIVLFILDPTGTCGWDIEEQERLLNYLKNRYNNIPFIEVESKSDLYKRDNNRLKISSLKLEGLDKVVSEIEKEVLKRYINV
jgi:nucleolar GTP-binding protein